MDSFPIGPLDVAVAAVLLISAFFAFARGFVHELLSVAGWIGAIFATIYGFPYVKPYARQFISQPLVADLAAGVAIFLAALIVLSILTRAVSRRVQESALNALDRSLGFVFGLARGALLVCLAYIGYDLMLPKAEHPEWMRKARSMPLIAAGAGAIVALLPPDTAERLGVRAPKPAPAPSGGKGPRGPADAKPAPGPGGKAGKDGDKGFERLLRPEPKAPERPASEGYGDKERQELQRLIDGAQR